MVGDLGATVSAGARRARRPARALPRHGRRHVRSPPRTSPSAPAPRLAYLRPWLANQAAGGYVDVRRRRPSTWSMTPEQAARARRRRTARRSSPAACSSPSAPLRDVDAIEDRFRTGDGFGWHEHDAGPVRRDRTVLPPGLRREPRRRLAAGARRRGRPSSRPGPGRRRRLRTRRVDDPDGAGLPALDVRRHRLPRGLDRRGPPPAPRRPASADRVRFDAVDAADLAGRRRLRPRHDVRLPARHGRPGRPPPGRRAGARRRRHAHGRRADGRRPRRGQPATRSAASSTAPRRSSARPRSLAQPGRARRSAPQAGPARLTAVLREAGFGRVRIAATTPVNLVLEARP